MQLTTQPQVFDNIKDFCRFIDNFEGELVIRNNKIYCDFEFIAIAEIIKTQAKINEIAPRLGCNRPTKPSFDKKICSKANNGCVGCDSYITL